MSGRYEIVWTTPHCVLTLRLIGLVIDIYDGRQKRVSRDQNKNIVDLNTEHDNSCIPSSPYRCLIWLDALIAFLRSCMKVPHEKPGRSLQKLKGSSLIDHYLVILSMITPRFNNMTNHSLNTLVWASGVQQ